MAGTEPRPPQRHRLRWIFVLAVGLLALVLIRGVEHRFFQMELIHARNDLAAIRAGLEEFADAHSGRYPADLRSVVTPEDSGKSWLEDFNGNVPKDPWKHEYQYAPPTPGHPKPRVWSFGADGKVGGSGADKDIDGDS